MANPIEGLTKDLRELADAMQASTNAHTIRRVAELRAQADAVDALQVDADRYRGVRNVICAQDNATFEAIETFVDSFDTSEPPTPERVDVLIDGMLLTAAQVHS